MITSMYCSEIDSPRITFNNWYVAQVLYVEPDMMNKLHSVLDPATLEEMRALAESQVLAVALSRACHCCLCFDSCIARRRDGAVVACGT